MSEQRTKEKSTNKKNMAAVIAILLVCVLAIGGTIAYLTSHSTLTNKFTVGKIDPINPGGGGPDGEKDPTEDDKKNEKLNGNLYEPNWDKDNAKLMPNVEIAKDPYVGVGGGSEPCAVYVYVKNTMTNNDHIYFAINEGWEAVEATTVKGNPNQYTGGIFKYAAGLDATGKGKGENLWTKKPLFTEVIVDKDADQPDFVEKDNKDGKTGDIIVQAFLHQTTDAKLTDTNSVIPDEVILKAAKEAFKIK